MNQALLEQANSGDAVAQYELGMCYFEEEEDEFIDYKKAAYWLRKSAAQNNALALYWLAVCYSIGRGVKINNKKHVELLLKSAALNHPYAILNLGEVYYYGKEAKENKLLAFEYFEKARDLHMSLSYVYLGYKYEYGETIPVDKEKALALYHRGAELGSTACFYELGNIYAGKRFLALDKEKAYIYLSLAAVFEAKDAVQILKNFKKTLSAQERATYESKFQEWGGKVWNWKYGYDGHEEFRNFS